MPNSKFEVRVINGYQGLLFQRDGSNNTSIDLSLGRAATPGTVITANYTGLFLILLSRYPLLEVIFKTALQLIKSLDNVILSFISSQIASKTS